MRIADALEIARNAGRALRQRWRPVAQPIAQPVAPRIIPRKMPIDAPYGWRAKLDKRFHYLQSMCRHGVLSADALSYPAARRVIEELCDVGLVAYEAMPINRYASLSYGYRITDTGRAMADLYEADRLTALAELYAIQQKAQT